jgi:hypothetical protein
LSTALYPGAATAVLLGWVLLTSSVAAVFLSTTATAGNSFTVATLQPPTGLSATVVCVGGPVPTYRTGATAGTSGPAQHNVALTVPASTVTGDLLLSYIVRDHGTDATLSPPSGWTLVRSDFSGAAAGGWVYRRYATSGDPGTTYTWSVSAGGNGAGTMLVYSGVDQSTPIDVNAGTNKDPVGSSFDAPSVTTTITNTRLVVLFGIRSGGTVGTPTGMTQRLYRDDGSSATALDQSVSAAGSTGVRTGSPAQTGSAGVAATIALRGVPTSTATLSWTATTSTFATGYEWARDGGSTTSVTPRTAVSTTDAGPLTEDTQSTWTVNSVFGTWGSTTATATATPNCS